MSIAVCVLTSLSLASSLPPTCASSLGDAHSTFGCIVGAAGDIDLDGTPDIVVGENGFGLPEFWIVSGKDGSTLRHFKLGVDTSVGARVEGGVDVDGDGVPDLLIAAQPYGRNTTGTLHLVSGKTCRVLRT